MVRRSDVSRGRWLRLALAAPLCATSLVLRADLLAELPGSWGRELEPIAELDVSGAEPLVRQAIGEARAAIVGLLEVSEPDRASLANAYGRLGAIYQLQEVQSGAEACYENARRLQPDGFRWTYYAGYLALRAGRADKALADFNAAQELRTDYPPLTLRLGEARMDKGDFPAARILFEQAAEASGLRAAALYYLGQIDLLDRRYEAAAEHLEEALRLNPGATEAHYPLAQAYRALGDDTRAREHLARFEPRVPTAEDPLIGQLEGAVKRSVPLFSRGMQAIYERDFAAAAELFGQGLEVDPNNAPARVSYARALFLGGDAPAAERELRRALTAENPPVLARFLLGVVHEAAERIEAAADAYRETLALDPSHAGAHYALANLAFRQKRYEEAAAHYGAALGADRDVQPARLMGLVAQRQAGGADSSIAADLDQLAESSPRDPALQYARSRLLALSPDGAARDPGRALELASRLVAEQPIPPYVEVLALSYAANGRFDDAVRAQQALVDSVAWAAPAPKGP